MGRGQRDPLEEMLQRGGKSQKPQDDIVKYIVIFNGEEIEIKRKERKIVWRPDPQNGGVLVPYTESDYIYNLADDGQPFGDVKNVASCIYGCKVKAASLYRCKHCRSAICGSHSLFVGRRTYCRKGVCFAIGLVSKILWSSFRLVRFCVTSILGNEGEKEENKAEADFFYPQE